MTTAFRSRFRGAAVKYRDKGCVDDTHNDSSDDGSPLRGDVRRNPLAVTTAHATQAVAVAKNITSEHRSIEKKKQMVTSKWKKTQSTILEKPTKKTFGYLSCSQSSWTSKKSKGKNWYSDSEEDEEELTKKETLVKSDVKNDQDEERGSDLDSYIAGSMLALPERKGEKPTQIPEKQLLLQINRLTMDQKERVSTGVSVFDETGKEKSSLESPDAAEKKMKVLRLLESRQAMSPFSGKEKEFGSGAAGLAASPPALESSTLEPPPSIGRRPTEVLTGGNRVTPTILINRRTDQLKHSASGSEYSGSPRLTISSNDEVLSPGLRKASGAFPGRPGSGVLLEGWLRQKQRRGIKGLQKWNSRYFVLYARSNEVRYYADVVQSAWGPIPLGEIGSISLRLIQRIGKLSHPKYKGCRFDITCRNSWGTSYADDYVSSDEDNASSNNNASANLNNEKTGATVSKPEKGGTPRSSRVYSLVADSPQVTVAWVNMLDSLLTRSANSPRPDVGSPAEATRGTSTMNGCGRTKEPRAVARHRSSAVDTEPFVILGPGECVPKATIYAINFIFDSTPGIETERFYEIEPDATKLKAAMRFLNTFAGENVTRKPTKDDLENLLDAVTASAVVRLWLKQLEQPLIPFTMYDDFEALAREAQAAPFDLRRNLRALLKALPKKNLTMLACFLFHLNDVNVYSSKNGMDAARLAHHFAKFILRPEKKSFQGDNSIGNVDYAVSDLVKEMITNVDTFIDEKEAQLLEDNRL